MPTSPSIAHHTRCRSPHGERGLKFSRGSPTHVRLSRSLSSWRAWIEMLGNTHTSTQQGRSPHGERGLKYRREDRVRPGRRRSPHGERGLKSECRQRHSWRVLSLSSWRAWIEIVIPRMMKPVSNVSLSSWRAWIEIRGHRRIGHDAMRRSPHGERGLKSPACGHDVPVRHGRSPHGERGLKLVDIGARREGTRVALLMESVD